MRKFTLVLASDLRKRDWVCHFASDLPNAIDNLNCVPLGVIIIPKSQYPGTIDPTPVYKRSCMTGIMGEFRIVTIDFSSLENKFNLL